MVLGDGEAYFCVGLEPSIFVHEDDVWRLEGILVRQQYLSMIQSLVKLCPFWSLEGEMPSIEVIRQGTRFQIGQLLVVHLLDFCHYPLRTDVSRFHRYYIITQTQTHQQQL